MHFENFKIDNKTKLITLLNNRTLINIGNLTTQFLGKYMYISDPPVFADLGYFTFALEESNLYLDSRVSIDKDNIVNFTINDINITGTPNYFKLQGISDLSNVLSRLVTFIT